MNKVYSDCFYADVCQSECSQACIRYLEMRYLVQASNIPENKRSTKALTLIPDNCDYDAFVTLRDIKDDIESFVKDGRNLYICSAETGNGKTTWAIKMLLKYFDSVWAGNGYRTRGLFIHVPTFLSQLKNFKDPLPREYINLITTVDLIVFDDIAGNELSAYDSTQLLSYIDQRVFNEKSCIFTSNITEQGELEKLLGNRISSRVWNSSIVVEFSGKDRRSNG